MYAVRIVLTCLNFLRRLHLPWYVEKRHGDCASTTGAFAEWSEWTYGLHHLHGQISERQDAAMSTQLLSWMSQTLVER